MLMSRYAEACSDQSVARTVMPLHSVAINQASSRSVNSIAGKSRRTTKWRLTYCVRHNNLISALHKSLRGSDPDAALYWLARMLESGEDPLYVVRRLIRFASEDVGMADPQALLVCVAAQQAAHFVGMPECALALAQAVVHLACAPKEQRPLHRLHRLRRRRRRRPCHPQRPGAATPAQRSHTPHEGPRLRQGLRLSP
jgi:replication-associated recombination protein RarA